MSWSSSPRTLWDFFNLAPTGLVFASVGIAVWGILKPVLNYFVGKYWITGVWALLAIGTLAYWGFEIYNYVGYLARRQLVRGAVLVTGTSSGIGKQTALSLYNAGLDVYAGVRSIKDGENLIREIRGIVSPRSRKLSYVVMDITNDQQVRQAYFKIAAEVGSRGLLGLVNNVGIPGWGPLELLSIEDFHRVMDVNFYGQLRVLTTFAPLLRLAEQTGQSPRIAWIGSWFGVHEVPGWGPYLVSKHALEAAAHVFTRETFFGTKIRSSIIEPWLVRTNLPEKLEATVNHVFSGLTPADRDRWRPMKEGTQLIAEVAKSGISTDYVTSLVDHAIFAPFPNRVYHTNPERPGFLLQYLPHAAQDGLSRLLYGRVTREVDVAN
jgi:NAD(P)-dependent dehydrogenase (short-subunit alcohol dehydrogenase family)